MLEHMHDDVSYEDIIRQIRILLDIENTLNDIEIVGSPADRAVEAAQTTLDERTDVTEDSPDRDVDRPSSRGAAKSPGTTLYSGGRESYPGGEDALLHRAVWHY